MLVVDIERFGKKYRVQVPDDAPQETWQYGIVLGPPDLSSLGLPPSIELRLHNELHIRGLISKQDLVRRMPDVTAALCTALTVDAQRIAELYEEKHG